MNFVQKGFTQLPLLKHAIELVKDFQRDVLQDAPLAAELV